MLRSLAVPDATTRINAITSIHGVLETGNMSAEVDTIVHDRAKEIVEALLNCILPSPESNGVRPNCQGSISDHADATCRKSARQHCAHCRFSRMLSGSRSCKASSHWSSVIWAKRWTTRCGPSGEKRSSAGPSGKVHEW